MKGLEHLSYEEMKRIWESCECLAWGRRDSGRTLSVCINSLLVGGSEEDRHGLFPMVPCARARGNVYKWKPGNSISNKENTYYGVQEVFGQCFQKYDLIVGCSCVEPGPGHIDPACGSLSTQNILLFYYSTMEHVAQREYGVYRWRYSKFDLTQSCVTCSRWSHLSMGVRLDDSESSLPT